MEALPGRSELVGLAGVAVGFVTFTFGALAALVTGVQPWTVGVLATGGLVGLVASGYLVVHYHVITITGW